MWPPRVHSLLHMALVLICVTAAAAESSIASHALRNTASDVQSLNGNQVDEAIKPEDVWVHAFDMGLCGLATFRPWQEQENAFNCSSGRDEVVPRIINGMDALDGEFPSYVQLNKTYEFHDLSEHECGATLIDKNYVVTAAHCVVNSPGLALTFGSNRLNGDGGQVRKATKWCYSSDYEMVGTGETFVGIHNDLAIIRFDEPIEYKLNQIWPACVNLNARHSPTATCALVGLGMVGKNDQDDQLADRLQTQPARRLCESNFSNETSCYRGTRADVEGLQGIYKGDSGGPVYCYDYCADDARTRAFAVGAVSDWWVYPDNIKSGAADFSLQRSRFLRLLKAARLEGDQSLEGIVCKQPAQIPPVDVPVEAANETIKPEDVWVHAFDMELCGLASFRPWQEQQSAFNCTSRSPRRGELSELNAGEPRIINGVDALEGEFPSYVQINATYNGRIMHDCGATLIDKNYVVTAAHCIVDKNEPMVLTFGSRMLDGAGRGQVRRAAKWCYPADYKWVNLDGTPRGFVGIHSDLAIIRFDEAIEYKLDKIWPACVNLNARHSPTATCSLLGLGMTGLESTDRFANRLRTLPARRACEANFKNENSCYLGTRDGVQGLQGIHKGDSGSPVICYDHCATDARTQAFAVGAVSDYWINPGVNIRTGVADFSLQRVRFLKLLKAARLEGAESLNGIVCKQAPPPQV